MGNNENDQAGEKKKKNQYKMNAWNGDRMALILLEYPNTKSRGKAKEYECRLHRLDFFYIYTYIHRTQLLFSFIFFFVLYNVHSQFSV